MMWSRKYVKETTVALSLILPFALEFLPAHAAEEDNPGYSRSQVRSIRTIKTSRTGETCATFEATFSKPLKKEPSVILDIENLHGINGVLSKFLDVIRIGPKKFRFLMQADAEIDCNKLLKTRENITVTIDSAVGEDNLPVIPDQRVFRNRRNPLVPFK